ncbi:hypothetical protein RB195_026087 [Necator americanus]|uniref:Myb-like DNA-binding domain protein n=1 Tax=Necator americanus TaxID=51031 RepID=A0ABR1EVA7_NECAM
MESKRDGLRMSVKPKVYFDIELYEPSPKRRKAVVKSVPVVVGRSPDKMERRTTQVRRSHLSSKMSNEFLSQSEEESVESSDDDMASSSGGSDSNDIIICINCRQLIQYKLHIKCGECPAMICIDCFSYGCEAGPHLRGHNYEIRDPLGGRTFDAKGSWGAIEEKRLLASAYRYKLGNWGEVTKLMETNRSVSQVQEYYDRFFIRGPIGQIALKRLKWEENKKAMIADGTFIQQIETDRITYMLTVIDALKESKTKLDPENPNLTNEVDDLVQKHLSRLQLDSDDRPNLNSEQSAVLDEVSELALSDDSCDPSDMDEVDKKAPEDAYSTGLEPENDSDDEDTNMSAPSGAFRTAKLDAKVENKCVRKSSRQSAVLLRPSKVRIRCGLRKSNREKNGRSSRYRRVMPDSSSTDEDSDDAEPMETDQTSADDRHEPTHGLEKEHSTDEYTASESEATKRSSTKQFSSSSVRRKRRARFVSKKARRLKEFQKRMARMNKAAEKRLHELSELCPAEDIRGLRDTKPNLALYTHDYSSKPKVRQSDMDMLAYNAARNDFEWEWYNDAEQLISRLMIQESSDKVEDLENDIKFARLERYNRILKTRKTYRRAIVEHDKIPEFFRFMMNMTMEKRKASQIFEQRSPLEKLLARAQQCLTKKEIEDLRNHLEKTNELLERISKLQELQRSGVITLKEAVPLMIALHWTHMLMDSLPSLLFLTTVIELYCKFSMFSSLLLSKKRFRCCGKKEKQSRSGIVPCSLESMIGEKVLIMDEVVIEGPAKLSLFKLKLGRPHLQIRTPLSRFHLRSSTIFHNTGGSASSSKENQSGSSSSQGSAAYPVNVDAVLGANTVEDIADTHPDFARLLLDCYSAGCDLEEYKREFQRLKNLRIKRQGGVNQTLSFSLFPSVPSDLPGHLFVRLMKFHSLYEGACRKYLTDVVNRRAEAAPTFPYDLSTIGIQELIHGSSSVDLSASRSVEHQSCSVPYQGEEFRFTEPSGLGHRHLAAEVAYSPAVNTGSMRRFPQQGTHGDQQNLVMGMSTDEACLQLDPTMMSHGTMQLQGSSTMVDRRLAPTPLPTWSIQQSSVNEPELRSRMATPLPPLEIRQCPMLQTGMGTPVPRVESRAMQTPIQHLRSTPLATPVPRVESRQSYSVVSGPHGQQFTQMRSSSAMHIASCSDNRMMTTTPMIGTGDHSMQNQVSPFATPTKKPRARRKVAAVPGTNPSQPQPAMTLQGRQMTATPIPGWQPHQVTKQTVGMHGQPVHVQNRSMMSASVTPLQRQLGTPASEHREMLSSTPLPGWGSHQVGQSGSQVERSPLVSSLPPLSQFASTQSHARQLKTPYPSMQSRQLVTPAPHSQPCEAINQPSYDQSSQLYPQTREIMTPAPFAQAESVSVPYPQGQNIATPAEMYTQQNMPSYQWSEESSMSAYRQQGQYVQHSYNQRSQFNQQISAGNQQVGFVGVVGNQSAQYSTQTVHPQQPHYPQGSNDVQKVSAFSQPYSYVQQPYPMPTYQQQADITYSQDSSYTHASYPQRSPYTPAQQQQGEQQQQQSQPQQQNQAIQQHLNQSMQQQQQHQQQQPIQRQVYENSAQYAGQFIPTYTTQPACGMQNTQHTPAAIQVHQMSSSCEVVQHGSEIVHQQSNFNSAMLDMSGSSTGTINDMIQNAPGEALDVSQGDNSYTNISGSAIIDPMMDNEMRTFGITQVPPPPRNDSEATVPARTSPNSCSPGLGGDDETNSLIPTIFYPSSQNDMSDLRIQDSPVEKGLNCQHFRFDIILAMKHHRIAKEDYERTLQELDQMEKEKCVGPLGDMLMKRLGLKRQTQQGHGGKFSVDELVAAFAANASIRDHAEKMPERRDSSELFSEFLSEITPSSFAVPLDPFNVGITLPVASPASQSLQKSSILQSGDTNDLGFLLSDDVIAEFDSLSKLAKQTQKPASVGESSSCAVECKQPLSVGSPTHCKGSTIYDHSSSGGLGPLFSSSSGTQKSFEALSLAENKTFLSSPIEVQISVGQPAAQARRSPDITLGPQTGETTINTQFESSFPPVLLKDESSQPKQDSKLPKKIASMKPALEGCKREEQSVIIGAPALPARKSDIFANVEYEDLSPVSPVVISPEPLSDEPEWWRKDEKTLNMSAVTASSTTVSTLPCPTQGAKSAMKRDEESIYEDKEHSYIRVREPLFNKKSHSPESIHEKKSTSVLESSETLPLSRPFQPKNSDGEEFEPSTSKESESVVKKYVKKSNKYLFGSDTSSDESTKEENFVNASSVSRLHHSNLYSSVPTSHLRKSRSPHSHHPTSPRSSKKKSKKSSVPSKQMKDPALKSSLSKLELSRELLAKQISEIIEEERSKLPLDEAKQLKRPLSPATLDVVIQDLMQHHISEDTSPNRELFASKLLGTDLFSKLFFRAGKCVFRHYEELDDLSRKDKGKGSCQNRRKGVNSRKRDTELLRGIRKSREIQKYRDAVRAAKEPSEAEKAAAAERAKLEAMPWLARSTFKSDIQQGSSSRFVIPKKSASSGSGTRQISDTSKVSLTAVRSRDLSYSSDADVKPSNKIEDASLDHHKCGTNVEKINLLRRSRSPPAPSGSKALFKNHQEDRTSKSSDLKSLAAKQEEVTVSFSFTWIPKSGSQKARAKHTWPLKRWRSTMAFIEEPVEISSEYYPEEHPEHDSSCVEVLEDISVGVDSFAEVTFKKAPAAMEICNPLTTAECASATEAELAALALQEELSRSEQGSPDDQYDALRYLAAMPESEFQVASENVETNLSSSVTEMEVLTSKVEKSACPPTPSKLFSPERTRGDENQFDQMDWIRMEHVPQPFFPSDFESDPWRLPLSGTESLTPKHILESPQAVVEPPNTTSLYSSLQEELDTIVRDTLGDTVYKVPTSDTLQKSDQSNQNQRTIVKFEWPKADVPVRSYAPDIVLPKLICDKSKIPFLDMCRCKRCMTRCVYFCDEEEWKYLYDCALSRRNKKEGATKLPEQCSTEEISWISLNFLKKPAQHHVEFSWTGFSHVFDNQSAKVRCVERTCYVTQNFLKRSAHARVEFSWRVYQHAFEHRSAKFGPIERVCSTTQNFLKRSNRLRTEHNHYVTQRSFDSVSMSIAVAPSRIWEFSRRSASEAVSAHHVVYQRIFDSCKFLVMDCKKLFTIEKGSCENGTNALWLEYQHAVDNTCFSTREEAEDAVLTRESYERMAARTVLPVHQRILIRCSMSVFPKSLDVDIRCSESAISQHVSVPMPRIDSDQLNILEVTQARVKPDANHSTRANINIPRVSAALLRVITADANFDTPAWIMRNSLRTATITMREPRIETTVLNVFQLNVKRGRRDPLLVKDLTLSIPRTDSTSLTFYSSTPGFLRSGPHMCCEICLPLIVDESTFYTSNLLRVRRKRIGLSQCASIDLPIPRVEAEVLNVCEVTIERKRRGFSSRIAISITIPRLTSALLTVCDAVGEQKREGFSEVVGRAMPLPRKEYAVLNALRLNVRRKRLGQLLFSEITVDIPRETVTSFSATDVEVDRTRLQEEAMSEIDMRIPREEDTRLKILELRVKRRRNPFLENTEHSLPVPRIENAMLNVYDLNARRQRASDQVCLEHARPISRHFGTACSINDREFDIVRSEDPIVDYGLTVDVPSEEDASIHIFTVRVRRSRKQQSDHVTHIERYLDKDNFVLSSYERENFLTCSRDPNHVNKVTTMVVDIPRMDAERLHLSTLRASRKRKCTEETTVFIKKLALEDRADLFLTERSFYSNAVRFTEVIYIRDPRLPEQCSNSFMEVSQRWRKFAHQHMSNLPFSSYLVTQFATLLQRVFSGALDRGTITFKDLHRLVENTNGLYDIDVFTNPQKVLTSESISSGPLWDMLMKLRIQRNSTEILSRKLLAPLYIFLGVPNLPRNGRPWRKWLKPLEPTSESRIGWQLALCMRIPDLVGVDDMDCKLQAIKMWWTVMMLRGTVPWSVYPCFSRRQLFILVRLLEVLQDVDRPPFSLYPPKAFFKAVKKILRHPRFELIPKDIYHPDVTVMVTLLKLKPNRVFQVDRSLPELLSHWLDDMNKIDAYLASDVDITPIPQSKFLTMTEWAWANYNQGCAPDWIEYDRTISFDETVEKLTGCLKDVTLPLDQRRRISMLKKALITFSKFEIGPDLDQVPIDIINPFALSASLISKLPMPESFVEECFAFLEEVAKRSSQSRQNPVKRNTRSLLSWKWKPSGRLAYVGKHTSDGTKVSGKPTINTIFEEFWRRKEFSTISSNSREESVTPILSNVEFTSIPVHSTLLKCDSNLTKQFVRKDISANISTQVPVIFANTKLFIPASKNTSINSSRSLADAKIPSDAPLRTTLHHKVKSTSGPPVVTGKRATELRLSSRMRKRKESAIDDNLSKSTSIIQRPVKRSRVEMRKRTRAKGSDEDGPSSKQRMSKMPEHRSARLRHTVARKGMETERMVHETVLRASAMVAAQSSNAHLPAVKSKKRRRATNPLQSSDEEGVVVPSKAFRVKKSRFATIFDVANFEWVLEMSLRRPRAFVDLYKTMRYQYRSLEKRRWVERNQRLYHSVQFDKFLTECNHSEIELLEKAKLLKAEKDMENVLGVSRADATKMEKFATKDLSHWYGMSARYAKEAETLASITMANAKKLDDAIEEVIRKEEEAEEIRVKAAREHSIQNAVAFTLRWIVEKVVEIERKEHEMNRSEVMEEGQNGINESLVSKEVTASSISIECDADDSDTSILSLLSIDMEERADEEVVEKICDVIDVPHMKYVQLSDKLIPPIFHMQSRVPITSSFVAILLAIDLDFKSFIPFEARFKRPRRIDHETDLLPPGGFSPYSTDEEWEEYYEKKDRFENRHPSPPQFSWKSCGRANDEGDDDESTSEQARHVHCECSVAFERTKQWVESLESNTLWRSYSEEMLTTNLKNQRRRMSLLHPIIRSYSALSCVSLEKLPILIPFPTDSMPKQLDEGYQGCGCRRRATSLFMEVPKVATERSSSLPPEWKPSCSSLKMESENFRILCESRRNRQMYPRNLSACRYRTYGIGEQFAKEIRVTRRKPHNGIRVPTHREEDPPIQWIKRDPSNQHDLLRTIRYWLEGRIQHNIPVLWCTRTEQKDSPMVDEEIGDELEDSQDVQVTRETEQRECPLEYPIAVYNPPPSWKKFMELKRKEKRAEKLTESLDQSTEPSAFQRVLQRPQPIDVNKLDVALESDDESENRLPEWPLLKKLREMERELLAAGNPIAVERQKVREFNRKLRMEMSGQEDVEGQLRHLQQLYLEYLAAQQFFAAQDKEMNKTFTARLDGEDNAFKHSGRLTATESARDDEVVDVTVVEEQAREQRATKEVCGKSVQEHLQEESEGLTSDHANICFDEELTESGKTGQLPESPESPNVLLLSSPENQDTVSPKAGS